MESFHLELLIAPSPFYSDSQTNYHFPVVMQLPVYYSDAMQNLEHFSHKNAKCEQN